MSMYLIGILIGCIMTLIIFRTRSVGVLRVDSSDPDDGPYLFLELKSNPQTIVKKKYVVLKVLISKAEKELEEKRPRQVDHLKDLLENDWKEMYGKLTEEGKQEFWQDLIKEIKLEEKRIIDVIFFT